MAELLTQTLLFLPVLLMAVTVHEAAHAWAALRLGDPTAEKAGRLSLLPFSHLDPLGSLLIPAALIAVRAPFFVGYGKPAPVDPGRLRRPKLGFSLVALAGPAANLGLALAFCGAGAFADRVLGLDQAGLRLFIGAGIVVNGILAALNLLPLPGFDGLKALYVLLPDEWCWRLQRQERLFPLLLVLLAWTFDHLMAVLWPVYWLVERLCAIAGIPLPLL